MKYSKNQNRQLVSFKFYREHLSLSLFPKVFSLEKNAENERNFLLSFFITLIFKPYWIQYEIWTWHIVKNFSAKKRYQMSRKSYRNLFRIQESKTNFWFFLVLQNIRKTENWTENGFLVFVLSSEFLEKFLFLLIFCETIFFEVIRAWSWRFISI